MKTNYSIFCKRDLFYALKFSNLAGVAQLVERLICNQQVGGSSPPAGFWAGTQAADGGAGCKPAGLRFHVGSNPTPPINAKTINR